MSDGRGEEEDRERKTVRGALRRGVFAFAAYMLLLAVAMFWPAGRLGWARGWAFLLAFLLLNVAAIVYLWRVNPEIVVARAASHRGSKPWDRGVFHLLNVLVLAIFPIAALDDWRFHWSRVPLWLTAIGYLVFLLSMAGIVWVLRVNKFAEPRVRIQADRRHQVVDSGPYAVVRHPFYVAAFFMYVGMPLALGSYWALVPSVIAVLVLVVRTALEDRMLQNELDGYKEYAAARPLSADPGGVVRAAPKGPEHISPGQSEAPPWVPRAVNATP